MNEVLRTVKRAGIPLVTVAFALLYARGTVYFAYLFSWLDIRAGNSWPSTNELLLPSISLLIYIVIAFAGWAWATHLDKPLVTGDLLVVICGLLYVALSWFSDALPMFLTIAANFVCIGYLIATLKHRTSEGVVPFALAIGWAAFIFIATGYYDAKSDVQNRKTRPVEVRLITGESIAANLVWGSGDGVLLDSEHKTFIPYDRIDSITYGVLEYSSAP